jgi:hypothetical protein
MKQVPLKKLAENGLSDEGEYEKGYDTAAEIDECLTP